MKAKSTKIAYWIFTSLFALQTGFTAYAQLCVPQVAQVFAHFGVSNYVRIELSWVNLAGVIALLLRAPARLKEWAYAAFTITLGSAVIAHFAVGDDPSKWSWPAGTLCPRGALHTISSKR